ncbi:MAG TPA: hypothetical protein VGI70_18275 [Polyangiales bacterium]|jgi:hypothetical protein
MSPARLVVIESPFAGLIERNLVYADMCLFDSLSRGEAPMMGHLLYPRVLDDLNADHRERGIAAHCAWIGAASLVAVYADNGESVGMVHAVQYARDRGIPVERRELGPDWMERSTRLRSTPGFPVVRLHNLKGTTP